MTTTAILEAQRQIDAVVDRINPYLDLIKTQREGSAEWLATREVLGTLSEALTEAIRIYFAAEKEATPQTA